MKKSLSILAIAAVAALSMAACSDGGTVEKGGAAAASQSQEAKVSESAPAETAKASDPEFGDAYTWENGLKVAISTPKSFKPSEYASAEGEGKPLVFTVTITNGTKEDFDPALFSTTASSDGAEATSIFDSAKGVEPPMTSVKPGKTVTFKIGFTVLNAKDITMDVSPGFEYEAKTFVS